MSDPGPRIVVALDYPCQQPALELCARLDPARCRVKVGKQLFTACGPALVSELSRRGYQVFLDLKFHDIPNTVAAACRAAAELGVWMVNVHAAGGPAMLAAARAAVAELDAPPLLIAVTVLTSLDAADLAAVGITAGAGEQVVRLARLSAEAGLDGIVCSARDLALVDRELGRGLLRVTPGVRPAAGAAADDQKRTMTPGAARAAGADYLVIGRPITRAPDPLAALGAIEAEIAQTTGGA